MRKIVVYCPLPTGKDINDVHASRVQWFRVPGTAELKTSPWTSQEQCQSRNHKPGCGGLGNHTDGVAIECHGTFEGEDPALHGGPGIERVALICKQVSAKIRARAKRGRSAYLKKTLQSTAPLIIEITAAEAVVSVLPTWKMNCGFACPSPSRVSIPVSSAKLSK